MEIEGVRETRSQNHRPEMKLAAFSLVSFGIVSFSLVVYWIFEFMNGLSREGTSGNYHFLLMVLFIIFTSIGSVSFRVLTCVSRDLAKVVHAVMMSIAFIIGIFGIYSKWSDDSPLDFW